MKYHIKYPHEIYHLHFFNCHAGWETRSSLVPHFMLNMDIHRSEPLPPNQWLVSKHTPKIEKTVPRWLVDDVFPTDVSGVKLFSIYL